MARISKQKQPRKKMKVKSNLNNFNDLVTNRLKNDEKFFKASIKSAFDGYVKNGEIGYLLNTLRRSAEAFGISNLAKETGISRQNIYNILSSNGNPTIRNLELILKMFGYQLSIKQIRKVA